MEQVSEYFAGLSGDSRAWYTAKVTALGLTVDPYSLPSAYTKEEMKVGTSVEFQGNYSSVCTLYRHGKVW